MNPFDFVVGISHQKAAATNNQRIRQDNHINLTELPPTSEVNGVNSKGQRETSSLLNEWMNCDLIAFPSDSGP